MEEEIIPIEDNIEWHDNTLEVWAEILALCGIVLVEA